MAASRRTWRCARSRGRATIAVESPCYFGLLQILESLGMRALEIPTSPQHGLSIEALDLAFQTHGNIRAVVVVPNFQNPLGCVMPDAEKARLVALCERQQVPLIEDDTYGALTDDDAPLPAASPGTYRQRDLLRIHAQDAGAGHAAGAGCWAGAGRRASPC